MIGVTTARSLNSKIPVISVTQAYIQAVLRAGGQPVLLPIGLTSKDLDELLPDLDGILLTGGGDIDPQRFNGAPHPRVYDIDIDRDNLEIELVQRAAQQQIPFLGICRGIQVINVALGGTLFTHVADQLPGALRHDWYPDIPRDTLAHGVEVQPGSLLAAVTGSTALKVNSLHHQGLKDTAPALQAIAVAPDGLTEAVELPGHPFGLGVQWHPEWMPEIDTAQAIFRAFTAAVRKYRQDKKKA